MKALGSITSLLLFAFIATTADAATITGKVVGVTDGDTITVLTPLNEQLKVRLTEIDAPEKDQPYGHTSKQSLSELAFDKDVTVETDSKDQYGRTLGRVFVGQTDVNLQLVKNGAAWAYKQYLKDEAIQKAEDEARKAKTGLWALQPDQIMPPWEWRHGGTPAEHATPQPAQTSKYPCGGKTKCGQMQSCEEAYFYLRSCGLSRLDGDKDGVPCESMCR